MTITSAAPLVVRAQSGDATAFDELVAPLLPRALGAAFLVTRGIDDAEDAVQDAMMQAWRDVGDLRDPAAFGGWFRRLVIRAAVRAAVRGRRTGAVRLSEVTVGNLVAPSPDMGLQLAFGALGPRDRGIVVLRYYLGYSTRETAAALGIPEGTVKSRLHAAVNRLREEAREDPSG